MPEWLVVLLGLAATVAPIATGYLVAKRYQALGGGEAQIKLNVTLQDLTKAYEEKLTLRDDTIREMKAGFDECKGRLAAMEHREMMWLEEKIELKKELAAVYRRLGMTKRETDPEPE